MHGLGAGGVVRPDRAAQPPGASCLRATPMGEKPKTAWIGYGKAR